MRPKKAMLALLLTLAFLPGGPPGAAGATVPSASTTYSIGIIPFYSPEQIRRLYTPFIDHLNKTTGMTWELKLYHGVLARLKPLTNDRDRLKAQGWDDEIKNGFILPTGAYLEGVLTVHRIYREIMHEDQ